MKYHGIWRNNDVIISYCIIDDIFLLEKYIINDKVLLKNITDIFRQNYHIIDDISWSKTINQQNWLHWYL